MKAKCPSCKYIYEINESRIPDKGAYALCKKCNKRFFIQKQKELTSDTSESKETENDSILKSVKKCPKCGYLHNILSEECPKCGVIYKKVNNIKKKEAVLKNNTNELKKNTTSKYSTLIYFFRWVFGAIFLLSGLLAMLNSVVILSAISLVFSMVLTPSIYHLMRPNPHFNIGKVAKVFSVIVGITCILLGIGAFVTSKIFAGIICVLFGILLFPDVYQVLASKEISLIQTGGVAIAVIIGSWVASQYMLIDMDSNKSSNTQLNSTPKKINWKERDNSIMAYIMMENYVKKRLKSPKSADFPGILDGRTNHVKNIGEQKYRIISWVDSQNSFGAMIRTHFVGKIQQVGEDEWLLLSLEFVQR